MDNIYISVLGSGSETFLDELKAAGVPYRERVQKMNGPTNVAGTLIAIVHELAPELSKVLIAWLLIRASRVLNITLKNGTIISFRNLKAGPDAKELQAQLELAKTIDLIETKKPDNYKTLE